MKIIKVRCKDEEAEKYNIDGFTWQDASFFGYGQPWWQASSNVDRKSHYSGAWRTPGKISFYPSDKFWEEYKDEGLHMMDIDLKELEQVAALAEKKGKDARNIKKIVEEFKKARVSHRHLMKKRWS